MIKKEELLLNLQSLIEQEKMLIPLLNRHISSALSFSGAAPLSQGKLKNRLQSMVITHTQHLESLAKIKEDVERDNRSVY